MEAVRTSFAEPAFVKGLKKAFIDVGLAPHEANRYIQYTLGTRKKAFPPADDAEPQFRLSEATTELELVSRRDEIESESEDEEGDEWQFA